MDHTNDLQEIAEEIARINYGELHITIRNRKIVSYTVIQSKLKKAFQRKDKQKRQDNNNSEDGSS